MIVRREFIMTIGHSKTVEAFLKNAAGGFVSVAVRTSKTDK
jgi:translation initiation factor 2B subunit (eIF-2B alpha/beta/delta family)